ncbi:hypothetical protein GCM10010405_30750 [Streptomyces macrosporus]|uniref:Uncharacterized protein n=1 Tax=Streptomyces macrosporus TaxID=44032 RepID=A0ABN3K395_9ACTN
MGRGTPRRLPGRRAAGLDLADVSLPARTHSRSGTVSSPRDGTPMARKLITAKAGSANSNEEKIDAVCPHHREMIDAIAFTYRTRTP